MTSTDTSSHSKWTALRDRVAKVFELNPKGVNVPRAVLVAGSLLVTLVVMTAIHQQRYFLSVAFGILFVGLCDPGGDYIYRLRGMALVGLIGAMLTALGFGIGGEAWWFVVLATFVVTALGGLAINFGVHSFVAGILLNVWFLLTLSATASLPRGLVPIHGTRHWLGSSGPPSGSRSPSSCGWCGGDPRGLRLSPRFRPMPRLSN